MKRELITRKSEVLDQDMSVLVFGEGGHPVVAFQAQDAKCNNFEDFGMIDALADFIDAGTIQVFSVDSIDEQSWSDAYGDKTYRADRQEAYFRYVTDELVPLVHEVNGSELRPLAVGCSMGATHAALAALRRPDLFQGCISLSGVYDARYFFGDWMNEVLYDNSVVNFLPNMPEDHPYIELYGQRQLVMCVGQGAWEDQGIHDLRIIADAVHDKGIDAWCDFWGYDVNHDWPWWKRQIRYFLPIVLDDMDKTLAAEKKPAKKPAAKRARATAKKAAAGAKAAAAKAEGEAKTAGKKVAGAAKTTARKAAASTKAAARKVEDEAKTVVEKAGGDAKAAGTKAATAAAGAKAGAKRTATRAKATTKKVAGEAKSDVEKAVIEAKAGAKQVTTGAKAAAKDVAEGAKTTTKRAASAAKTTAKKASSTARAASRKAAADAKAVTDKVEAEAKKVAADAKSAAAGARAVAKKAEGGAKAAAQKVEAEAEKVAADAKAVASEAKATARKAAGGARAAARKATGEKVAE